MSERCNNPMCLDLEKRFADSVSRERYQDRCNDIVRLERQLKEAKAWESIAEQGAGLLIAISTVRGKGQEPAILNYKQAEEFVRSLQQQLQAEVESNKILQAYIDGLHLESERHERELQAANDRISRGQKISHELELSRIRLSERNGALSIENDKLKCEITQLRQERDQAINNCHYWKDERDALRAKLDGVLKQNELLATKAGIQEIGDEQYNRGFQAGLEQIGCSNCSTLRAERNQTHLYLEEATGKNEELIARVQELEKALKKIDEHDYHICNGWCFIDSIRIAKRALDGGKG